MKAIMFVLFSAVAFASSSYAEEYELRVSSETESQPVAFRAAIGHDNQLNLLESTTPFTKSITAHKLTALFESIDKSQSMKVELIGELEGEIKVIASFEGAAGRIIEEPGMRRVSGY